MLLEAAFVPSRVTAQYVASSQPPTLFGRRISRSAIERTTKSACTSIRATCKLHTLTGSQSTLGHIKDYTARNPVSIFHSSSNDPYHNLAIENHILKHSDPQSRILFTYRNRPCVVFGRNQNPWLECNISRLQEGLPWNAAEWTRYKSSHNSEQRLSKTNHEAENVSFDLVRRRSGGGTVIHDAGNLNFSFIVPNDKDFTRNKHAQLVVDVLRQRAGPGRQLRGCEPLFEQVRVNERHDIVMTLRRDIATPEEHGKVFKVSGSAFKLTRGRALHHGTLLLASPNLSQKSTPKTGGGSVFSAMLSSPAKPYLTAKGVGSVPSPVHNLFRVDTRPGVTDDLVMTMETELGAAFNQFYEGQASSMRVDDENCEQNVNEAIYNDVQEMKADAWRFCQTPSFEFSSIISNIKLYIHVKQGIIVEAATNEISLDAATPRTVTAIVGKKLHEIQDWTAEILGMESQPMIDHLSTVFPRIRFSDSPVSLDDGSKVISARNTSMGDIDGTAVRRTDSRGQEEVEVWGQNVVVVK